MFYSWHQKGHFWPISMHDGWFESFSSISNNLDLSLYYAQVIFVKQAKTDETSVKVFLNNWAKTNVAPLQVPLQRHGPCIFEYRLQEWDWSNNSWTPCPRILIARYMKISSFLLIATTLYRVLLSCVCTTASFCIEFPAWSIMHAT